MASNSEGADSAVTASAATVSIGKAIPVVRDGEVKDVIFPAEVNALKECFKECLPAYTFCSL